MEKLQMRRCSSLDWRPSPVVALASSFDASRVAAVREDATLEIWLVAPGSVGWHCLLTIPGNPASRLSSLVWSRPTSQTDTFGRLLSSSLDGSVFEWDISSLKQKKILDSMSMSIWQMALEPNDSSVISNPKQLSNGHVSTKTDVHSESESSIVGGDDDDDDSDDEASSTYVGATYQRLAMACDDGSIRLYNVPDSDTLNYLRSFPRVNGKMLSVTWSHDTKFIFSGSSDGIIRCWDVRSFHEKYRITAGLGGVGSGPNLCIWSLLSLRCGTLVSGDSSGSIQFWDSCHGTLIQGQRHHKGDVLALAAAPNHNRVFSSGSDGQVILYKLSKEETNKDETSKWVYVGYVRAHTHDVRALAVAVPISREDASVDEGKAKKVRKKDKPIEYSYHKWAHLGVPMLISSGDDAKLFAYSAMEFTNFAPHDICPAPQRPFVNFTNERSNDGGAQIMLTQQYTRLDMKLLENLTGNMKRIPTQPSHLQLKSEGSRRIVCSAISGDGTHVAYSHDVRPCLFELRCQSKDGPKGGFMLKKLKLPKGLPSACCMIFSVDSSNLIISGCDRKIYVVDVRKSEIIGTFDLQRKADDMYSTVSESPVTKMFTSFDGQWLAATNCFGDIYVFNLETQRQHWYVHRMNDASVTAGGFVPGTSNVLVVTTSGNEVFVLDVEAKQLGEWSRRHTHHLPRRFREFPGEVIGLAFPPRFSHTHSSVIVYSSRAMCFIDFSMPVDAVIKDKDKIASMELSLDKIGTTKPTKLNLERKRRRKNITSEENSRQCKNFDFYAFDHPVLYVSHLSEGSLLLVEKKWMDVVKTFEAPPVHKHVYGT